MCILLQYIFPNCLHVAKTGTYTCYAASCANLKSFEECPKLKVTSQKLKSKKTPKLCGRCLEAFGSEWDVKGNSKELEEVAGQEDEKNRRDENRENM